jgi:HAE1 family hydrophobic/amphiphilic exporter-1
MVVDDSIVVLENIARLREKGASIVEAAVKGTAEVGMAVTASTLTTVAVFFPLVFVQGVAGQLFRDQALTVTFAMLISLIVAMTLIPMLASLRGRAPLAYKDEPVAPPRPLPQRRFVRGPVRVFRAIGEFLFQIMPRASAWVVAVGSRFVGKYLGRGLRFVGRGITVPYDRAARFYHRSLPKALVHPWRVLGFAALVFALSILLVPTLGLDLIPQLAQGRFDMTVTLPPGTPLVETDKLVGDISSRHAKDANVASIYGVSGAGTRLDANPTESGENIARLSIALVNGGSKKIEADEVDRLRSGMVNRSDAEVKFSRPQLFSFSAPLEVEIRGYDLDSLAKAGHRLDELMKASPRFADIKSTVEGGYPEIQIRFDQDRAAALGLTTRDIADRVVRKVKGEVATRYDFRDRKIDVLVRSRLSDRGSVDDIRNLVVGYIAQNAGATTGSNSNSNSNSSGNTSGASGSGSSGNSGTSTSGNSTATVTDTARSSNDTPVRLSAVADVIASEGPSEIHRVSQERVAIVSANLRYGDLGSAIAEINDIVSKNPLAAGVKVHVGGQSEELDSSVKSLMFALGLAIFLVYLVMASQFESLLHPFVIMFSIPLAAVGAVLALKLTGSPVSVVVFIGLIMLVGIVVKNAIVLIDRVNRLREEGVPKREAIAQGAESRLRPIVMTTLCTLIGFSPLAIGVGEGAEVRAPMALTVIGGLAVSTLLTLVVIPVVYDLLDRRGDAWYLARGKRHRAKAIRNASDEGAIEPEGEPA